MLVLVATNETQGRSPHDFAYTVEGELVSAVATECRNHDCGCNRGFPGLASEFATTTAQVVDLPHLTEADLRAALFGYLDRTGWFDLLRDEPDVEMIIDDMIDEHVEAIAAVCACCPVGTIVERGRIARVHPHGPVRCLTRSARPPSHPHSAQPSPGPMVGIT